MKKLSTVLVLAGLLTVSAGLSSCIQKDYDTANLDKEITIIPGMRIPVEKKIDDIDLVSSVSNSLDTDENGNFQVSEIVSEKKEYSVSKAVFDQNSPVELPGTIEIPIADIPDFLSGSGINVKFSDPKLLFSVTNPLGADALLSFTASNGKQSVDLSTPVSNGASDSKVKINGDKVKDLFNNGIPEKITISSMTVKKQSSSTNALAVPCAVSGDTFKIAAGYELPLIFEAGSSISFTYDICIDTLGIDLNDESLEGFDISAVSVCGRFGNGFPLSVEMDVAVFDKNGKELARASLLGDKAIQAGKLDGTQVFTDFEIGFNVPSVKDIYTASLYLKACNPYDVAVSLKESQKVSLELNGMIMDEGVSVNFNDIDVGI